VPSAREDDILGRVRLVTGATSGIGKEVARGLALKRAHVVVASPDAEKGRRVAAELGDDAANPNLDTVEVDVADQASVRRFAQDFTKRFAKLHVLVLCAGVYATSRAKTAEGIERTSSAVPRRAAPTRPCGSLRRALSEATPAATMRTARRSTARSATKARSIGYGASATG
jgi:NAD(P)-dependent dehydrogenase (short-subunit alcohol dehydrogenase family)